MNTKNCPECGTQINSRARRCRCGWSATGHLKPKAEDLGCAINGCPHGGSIAFHVHKGGPWYCRHHAKNMMRYSGEELRKRNDALTLDMRSHPEKYKTPRHWADEMVDNMIAERNLPKGKTCLDNTTE